jgi:Domain of unknown function (DUF932)
LSGYLAALNSHGSSKFRLLLTSVRMVCANTQSAAIAGAKSTFGIRHTNGARVAIQEARTALGLAWRYMDAFETEADNLTLWAIYERDTATNSPAEVTAISADPVDENDPDLKEAMRLHRLTWSD